MLDGGSIGPVLDAMRSERATLLELLGALDRADWDRATECPAYDLRGIATHVLGDDLSLLSRQRDGEPSGLFAVALAMPGADFRTILDAFNDRWVEAAGFFSPALVVALLGITGEWTARYYEDVDPDAPGEPVGFFGDGPTSPFWQAIAREYVERWVHHSQIRRALGLGSLAEDPFLPVGAEVVATIARGDVVAPADPGGPWLVGPFDLGPRQQAADVLTRALTAEELRAMVTGPAAAVDRLLTVAAR
jgi:uncharacterized protein (TIGR03083 family)